MRIGFLVGACGLALAGAAHADRATAVKNAMDSLDNEFTRARDAATGKVGTAKRQAFMDEAREKIRSGRLDPRRSTLAEISDEFVNGDPNDYQRGISSMGQRVAATVGNPNPWAPSIDADDFHDGFEDPIYTKHASLNLLADFVPLGGQAAPNGNNWKASSTQFYNGLVDNTLITTSTGWGTHPGSGTLAVQDPAGPDGAGDRLTFFWEPRGTIFALTSTAYNTGFHWGARLDHTFYVPTGDPVVHTIDWYLDGLETFTWHRPVSSPEGFIITNMFMGGYDFATFAPFTNADDKINRVIILGSKPGSFDEGEFFVAKSHILKTGEWYNLAIRQGVDSLSMWIRDSETIGAYGFVDNSTNLYPSDFANIAGDGETPFFGEIFETDWVQFYPGLNDDPATTSVVEGSGVSENEFLQKPDIFNAGPFPAGGAAGSPVAAPLFAFGVEELQTVGGFDPIPADVPSFHPTDWGFDNWTVLGDPFNFADPQPDASVPYFDDIELWVPGPVAVQGLRWFDFSSFSEIVDNQNATTGIGLDGGTPEQSLRQTNIFGNGVYRSSVDLELFEEDLVVRAGSGTPLVHTSSLRVSGNATSRGFDIDAAQGQTSRVIIGGRDSNGIVDTQVYMHVDNDMNGTGNYDDSQPQDDVSGINEIWDGAQNRNFIPAPLETLGDVPSNFTANVWHAVTQQVDLGSVDPDDAADQTFFLDGVELRIDADFFTGLGAVTPNPGTDGFEVSEITLESGYEVLGLGDQVFWDDINLGGVEEVQPDVLSVAGAPFTLQPAFGLPYDDPFDGYLSELGLADGQSSTPFLGTLFTSNTGNQIDVIPVTGALSPGDMVYSYLVDDIVATPGTPPTGLNIGDTVVVEANFPSFRDPNDNAIPGSVGASRRVKFRNGALALQAEADMTLSSGTPAAWNGTDAVMGRYFFIYETRWQGDATDGFVVDDSGNNILQIVQDENDGDSAELGEFEDSIVSTLPAAIAGPGETVSLEVDMYVESDITEPRGRTAIDLRGPSFDELQITQFVFGGPHIYEDGDADGAPDNDVVENQSDPTQLYILRPNGIAATPPGLHVSEGYTVPLNTWFRVCITISPGGDWTFEIKIGAASQHTASGVAIDTTGVTGFGLSGTAGLDILLGNDPGGNGRPKLDPIQWTSLGETSSPEDGFDAQGGNFNSVPPKYFYQEIRDFDLAKTPDLTLLPDIIPVNQATGFPGAARDLEFNDVIVLRNDTGTAGLNGGVTAITGTNLADNNPRNGEWEYTEDFGTTILGYGDWVALGLPGDAGLNDPVPAGGLTANSAPYNPDVPFRTILMGSIVDLPAFPPVTANHAARFDDVHLSVSGCKWDVSAPFGVVDGADLATLLASWTPAPYNPAVDGNSDGVVDGADLAALLAFWGACP